VVFAVACGGPQPHADTPPPFDDPSSATPAKPAASGSPADAVTASSVGESPDVKRGIQALAAGDLAGAKAAFDAAIKRNSQDADATFYLGVCAEKAGDKAAAEARYKAALKMRPDLDSAAENLTALYDEAQRWDDAIAVANASLAKRQDNAALHANLGMAYAGKADGADATAELDKAVTLASRDASLRLTYAHVLEGLGKPDVALGQVTIARGLAEGDLGLLAAVGHELHLLKAFADCVAVFDKAVALKDAAELRTERAACKLGGKDADGAIADLQTATTNEPTYVPAHYYLANALASSGKAKEAIAEYQAFLKLQPSGPMAKAASEKIKLLRAKAK
jgi:Tfp pilus assembly protein PilF